MTRPNQRIDEYLLAAFIAGTLDSEERSEVVSILAKDEDARELLYMSYEALGAARQTGAAVEEIPLQRRDRDARRRERAPERAAQPRAARLQGLGRYVLAVCVVLAMGVGLRLAFGPPTDALRSPLPPEAPAITVVVSSADLSMEWNEVPEAYDYRLVFWDPQAAEVVARYETRDVSVSGDSNFIKDLRDKLDAKRSYTLRVDAVDAQNRLILSSKTVSFKLPQ